MNADTKELAAQLREFNRWRRGDETLEQPHPARIGAMIDEAADRLEDLERELAAERALADRLAHWLETLLSGYEDAKEIAAFNGEEAHAAHRAIKAWKEARHDS